MRIPPEDFLHQQGRRVHAAAHIDVSQSTRTAGGMGGHRCCLSASAATAAFSVAASTAPVIPMRTPTANSISIDPPLLAGRT